MASHPQRPLYLSPTTTTTPFDCCDLLRKTPLQLNTLENLYSDDKNPTESRLEDYAMALGLTYEQVKRWFVDRHRRDKRDADKTTGVNVSARKTAKGRKSKLTKDLSSFEKGEHENCIRTPVPVQDMLYSSNYIFKKIFRKDGPPLGVEFDVLPNTSCCGRIDITDNKYRLVASQEERGSKRRKVTKTTILDSEQQIQMKTPLKKHGKGKGLMSVWQLVNSRASFQDNVGAFQREKILPGKSNDPAKRHGKGKGFMNASQLSKSNSKRNRQRKKPTVLRKSGKKMQEKRKPLSRQRKVETRRDENQKARRSCCKIALNLVSCDDNLCLFPMLVDDEELELRELQAGSNPLTCGGHFAAAGNYGCSLCKGLLPKFPPDSVRMRKPLDIHPWNSSWDLEKKIFKVFQFLYTYAVVLDLCPFTLDELAMAFHDKDSSLLGKLHVCLLGFLLSDIQKEMSNGHSIHSNKNGRFLNLLHKAETQTFIVDFWKKSLNPLTWTEILRQVLIAAGFGLKDGNQSKKGLSKEADHMTKYGLRPGSLKGEVFGILCENGNKGITVAELSKASQIVDLNLGKTSGELEDSICLILAGDITLFEKISSSAYRLRLTSITKKYDDALSDDEDCSSIYDDSRVSSIHSTIVDCDSGNSSSKPDKENQSPVNSLSLSSVIDESHPGESWLLGLMEGEYSDLSIEEKLKALLALIDLVGAVSSIRMEDPLTALGESVPSIYQHLSGGKIKPSNVRQHGMFSSFCSDRETRGVENRFRSTENCPIDSSVVLSKMCEQDKYSGEKTSSNGAGHGDYLHPVQSIFLGSDRRHNRYWLFLGPCDANDPGHKRVYFESSEDGQWQVIDNEEALCGLMASLNNDGRREANLLASLEKRMELLLEEMSSCIPVDVTISQSTQSGLSEIDRINEDSPSPRSEIDSLSLSETSCNALASSCVAPFKVGKKEDQKQKYERLQAYDSWIWNGFYANLHAVRHRKRSFFDLWIRCGSCHDLYWRDERHCKICHTTFELDLDLEEKYTIHVATCQGCEDADVYSMHKVLPSKLQALKAAIHMIELIMPEDALIGVWKRSAHKLWLQRLKRTSSLHELLHVLADFVNSLKLDWVSQCKVTLKNESPIDDFVEHFQSMPQTSSAVALWLVNLDALIASQLDEGIVVGDAKGPNSSAAAVPVPISVD
ncbi:homeobox-DDT domain protein RLT3 isoform X1 [Amaranthus tricolor]|uniref:homeobox-DDT domain protein RLT3 isoform X1 n=2 Tax=Amaranthus tricolor TaxID=29722 RepID=UPI00258ACE17|nr:homeobox-DDT domain protein RLT3 isoform X1 [Amaranthus tricolor]